MPELAPVSDQEARDIFGRYDSLEDGPEKMRATTTLLQYRDQRVAQQSEERDAFFEGVYTDEAKRDAFWNAPALKEAAEGSSSPNSVRYRATNQAYLAHINKFGITDIDETYDAWKNGYAKANFGKDEMTDEAFFNAVAGQQKKKVDTRTALEEIPSAIVAARFAEGDVTTPEIIYDWRKKHAAILADMPPEREVEMLKFSNAAFQKIDDWMQRVGPEAKRAYEELNQIAQGFDSEVLEGMGSLHSATRANEGRLDALADDLAGLSREERNQIFGMIAIAAKTDGKADAPKGAIDKTGTFFENMVKRMDRRIADSIGGLVGVERDRAIENDPKLREKENVANELRNIISGQIDPTKYVFEGMAQKFEEGMYAAAESMPYMATIAIPYVGPGLSMAMYAGDEYSRMRLEYPNAPFDQVRAMSLVSGGAQMAIDRLQFGLLKGALGNLGKTLEGFARADSHYLTRLTSRSLVFGGKEYGQETLQNLTPLVVDEMAKSLGADMPDRDWSEFPKWFVDTQVDTVFALLPFMVLGVGGIAVRERGRGREFRQDAASFGVIFDADTARDIAATEDPEERAKKQRAAWDAMSEEEKRAAVLRVDGAIAAANEAQESPAMPTMERVIGTDAQGRQERQFVVRDAEGNEVYRSNNEEAANEAYGQQVEHETMNWLFQEPTATEADVEREAADAAAREILTGDSAGSIQPRDGQANDGSTPEMGARAQIASAPETAAIGRLGLPVIRTSKVARAAATYDPYGAISIEINPAYVSALQMGLAKKGADGAGAASVLLGEELVHGADLVALRSDWQATGSKDSFRDFVNNHRLAIFAEIRATIDTAPSAEKYALLAAVRDSYHIYASDLGVKYTDKFLPETLLDEIAAGGAKDGTPNAARFVAEFLRQATELKRADKISEETYQTLWSKLAAWVTDAIARIKEVLPGAYTGRFGKLAQEQLAKIERTLNEAHPDGKASSGETGSIEARSTPVDLDAKLKEIETDPEKRRGAVERSRNKLREIRERSGKPAKLSSRGRSAAIEAAKAEHTQAVEELQRQEAEALAGVEGAKERNQIKFSFTAKRRAADARLEKATAETAGVPQSREAVTRSLGELEAIISILPVEARGRIKGFRKLSEFKTDRGRDAYLATRIERVGHELEKWLKNHYGEKLDKLFKRAKPAKDEAGKKKVGKAGADIHRLFDTLREAVNWTPAEADAHIAGLESLITKGELTPDQEAHTQLEIALVGQLADWEHADAARREAAVKNATEVWTKAYGEYRIKKQEQNEARDKTRKRLIADTGKGGTAPERDAKALDDNGLKGDWKDNLLGLLNFEQVTKWVFGDTSKEAERIADMERSASNAKEDAIFDKMNALDDLFENLAGNRLAGEKLWWKLGQKTLDVQGRKLSELEGITALLMWKQEDGRRHMIGHLDEKGNSVGPWNYDQSFVDEIESKLSPDARAAMDFLSREYAGEWATLNPLYRELNGIDLPRHDDYAPLTVKPVQSQGGQTVDPVTGTTMTGAGTTPGSLRTRGGATAEPDFRDALKTYIAHTKQMEHWKAYAKFSNEARALINNREVGNAIEAKSGEQAVKVLRNWLDYFAQGGNRDAAASLAMTQAIERAAGRAASMALVGRIGTIAIQSTQLGAAAAEMPLTSYLGRLGRLLAGQLGWKAAFDSPYIQRRIAQMPPAVRAAMEGLRASKPNVLRHNVQKLARLISGADALFTAGTYAIVYDYQLKQLGDEALAREAAERIVDRLAQPTRAGTRSLFENTMTNPLARVGWAFASEARKNFALIAFAAAKRDPKDAFRALLYVVVLNSFVGAIIRNAWRDLRDDDDEETFDEKNWSWKRMALATITEPFYGVPIFGEMVQSSAFAAAGEWFPNDTLWESPAKGAKAVTNIPDWFTGERDAEGVMRDVEMILTGAGLFNADIAAAASLSHLARDLFGVGKNLTPDE